MRIRGQISEKARFGELKDGDTFTFLSQGSAGDVRIKLAGGTDAARLDNGYVQEVEESVVVFKVKAEVVVG